jgi:hypothetical protein
MSRRKHHGNSLAEFTEQLARRRDLGASDCWEVGLCDFSCPSPASGKIRPIDVVGTTNFLVYCDLITPQFVGGQYSRCLRTVIHEYWIILLNMYIICQSKNVPSRI